jgi:GNAT superfamily N-acetyltransferase
MIKLKSLLLENIESEVSQFEQELQSKYTIYLEQLHFYYDILSNSIFLSDIYMKPQFKGKGWGTKIIKELVKFADDKKLPNQLIPATDSLKQSSINRLIRFYKKFGFIENKGNPQFDDMGMYRMPK